jgi:hypothetical protein
VGGRSSVDSAQVALCIVMGSPGDLGEFAVCIDLVADRLSVHKAAAEGVKGYRGPNLVARHWTGG